MDLCTPRPNRGRWSKTSGKTLTKGSARSKLLDVQTVLFSSIRVRRQVSSMAEGSFALGHPGNSVSICVSMYLRVPGKPVYLREICFWPLSGPSGSCLPKLQECQVEGHGSRILAASSAGDPLKGLCIVGAYRALPQDSLSCATSLIITQKAAVESTSQVHTFERVCRHAALIL